MEQTQSMQMDFPQTGSLTPMALQGLLQILEAAMPVDQVLHALHVQAMQDPAIRETQAMKQLSEAGLHNLHAKVAAAGFSRLMLNGDRSEAVLMGLKEMLATAVRTHGEVKSAFTRLMGIPQARTNEALQSLSQVMGVADQASAYVRPYLTAVAGTGAGVGQTQ